MGKLCFISAESEGSTCATDHVAMGFIHVCGHLLAYPLEAGLDTPQTNMEPTQGVRFPKRGFLDGFVGLHADLNNWEFPTLPRFPAENWEEFVGV